MCTPRKFAWPILLFVLMIMSIGFAVKEDTQTTSKIHIGNTTFEVSVADTWAEKIKGLSGSEPLKRNKGMLFLYDDADFRTFWMRGMNYPIDIIWIREARVVGIEHSVPFPHESTPLIQLPRYTSPERADVVLEIAAGRSNEIGLKIGDYISRK